MCIHNKVFNFINDFTSAFKYAAILKASSISKIRVTNLELGVMENY